MTCGFGGSVLFTTYAFAGVYYALWTPLTVFTVMIATVMFVLVCAYRYALRLLMNVSLFGGTLAPLSLRPETDQVFALFLYMLVLNAGVFFIAIQKKWEEYTLPANILDLSMSIVLGVYALFVFFWGTLYTLRMYTVFGSIVLLGVAVKTIFFDLSGESIVYKMIVLVVLGLISLAFSYVRTIAEKRTIHTRDT